jgi:hypothetical protein
VYLSNRPRLLFFVASHILIKLQVVVRIFFKNMSSSSTTNTVQGSSRPAQKSRGVAPSPAIFPNVITVLISRTVDGIK